MGVGWLVSFFTLTHSALEEIWNFFFLFQRPQKVFVFSHNWHRRVERFFFDFGGRKIHFWVVFFLPPDVILKGVTTLIPNQ